MTRQSDHFNMIDLITSDGCVQLLHPFLYKPGIEMYQSEVIKETKVPKTRAIRLLNMLTGYGLLREKEKAGCKFYTASQDDPVVKQLKTMIMVTRLYELTREYSGQGIEVFIFGSSAKGEDTENSDVDLLVISSTAKDRVSALIDKIKNNLEREANTVVYTPLEYANLCNKEKTFYDQLERYKIRVL